MSLLSALMLATWMAVVYVVAYGSSPGCVCVEIFSRVEPWQLQPLHHLLPRVETCMPTSGGSKEEGRMMIGMRTYDMSVVDVRPCKKCKHMYSYIRAGGCLNINCCLACLVEEGSPVKDGSPLKKGVQACCVMLFLKHLVQACCRRISC